jgi:hypothetical protein
MGESRGDKVMMWTDVPLQGPDENSGSWVVTPPASPDGEV